MSRRMFLMLGGFLVLVLSVGAFAADTIKKDFTVSGPGLLKVESVVSSIEVTTWTQQAVAIEVDLGKMNRADFEERFVYSFVQSGNDVTVTIESKRKLTSWWDGFRNSGRRGFVVRVSVPTVFNADLETSGGSVSVADLNGDVRSTTSGGSLSFGNIDGLIRGRTSGGSIEVESCVGDVDVATSGGGIRLGQVKGEVRAATSGGSIEVAGAEGSVTASTSGGGINVGGVKGTIHASTSGGNVTAVLESQPQGDCTLSTSGGSVHVKLAGSLGFEVDAKTTGGRVRTDLPLTVSGSIGNGEVLGKLNGGGPQLKLRTSAGNITISTL